VGSLASSTLTMFLSITHRCEAADPPLVRSDSFCMSSNRDSEQQSVRTAS
jgi:hypothetical protein